MTGITIAAVLSAFGFGLRHGIDFDHLAAIGDIASTSENKRRAFELSTIYALAHAAVVVLLGAALILADIQLSDSVDAWFGRAVGATLILLGVWVFVEVFRNKGTVRLRSRWMLISDGVFAGLRKVRKTRAGRTVGVDHEHDHQHSSGVEEVHDHSHVETSVESPVLASSAGTPAGPRTGPSHRHPHHHAMMLPDEPFVGYGRKSATSIGIIHGVGVETPTQIAIFVATTQATGRAGAVLLLCTWVFGLLLANTMVAAAAAAGMHKLAASTKLHTAVAVFVGATSLVLGALMIVPSA